MGTVETKTQWKLICTVQDRGDCHGHLFDTEAEAMAWCDQQCVKDRYRYEQVEAAKCSCCGLFHITLDGDYRGWSCHDTGMSSPSDPLLAELRSLRAVRDAAEPVSGFLELKMSNSPIFDGLLRDLIAALDAHRAQEEGHGS